MLVLATSGMKTQSRPLPRLRDSPGSTLRLMVVSTGQRHCAGIDLASGALVRAWCSLPVDQRLCPYDLVDVTLAANPDVIPDPSEPDAVVIDAPPILAGHRTGRRALRLIRPLLHPEKVPLLGSNGPAVPFWERRPDHPSVALAQPKGPLMVTLDTYGVWCHFLWGGHPQVLACTDPRLAATLRRARRDAALMRPGTYLLVALEPPVEGQCHKVVEAVIPRR
jgi:hypothetical protein